MRFDKRPEHCIDSRLIATARIAEPRQYILVEAQRHHLFCLRHDETGLLEPCRVGHESVQVFDGGPRDLASGLAFVFEAGVHMNYALHKPLATPSPRARNP